MTDKRAQYNLSTLNTLGKRRFEVAAEDGRVLWKTERLLQNNEIIEVVHGLSEESHYSIHQYVVDYRRWPVSDPFILNQTDRRMVSGYPQH